MGDAMGIIVCQCVYVTVKAVTDHIINTQDTHIMLSFVCFSIT